MTFTERLRMWYDERRKRLPGLIALAAVGILNWLVSDVLSFTALVSELDIQLTGIQDFFTSLLPEFGLFGVIFMLAAVSWLFDWDRLTRLIFIGANSIATFNVCNFAFDLLLSIARRQGNRDAALLLTDAALVWIMNLVVFAIWYWMLDAGGPDRRGTAFEQRPELVYAQQQLIAPGWDNWRPGFIDYLFVAFCHSTGFGPGDTMILSRRVKVLSMVQIANSLIIVGMLAARAIGLFTTS
jgi:hypothetical protein